jgi:hypothetical protein
MSTGTDLILGSLRLLQAHSVASSAETETIVIGKDKLNSMLQLWISQGIAIETTPIEAVGDEVSEPEDTTNAIVENLAVEMEMEFGVLNPADSQRLHANAQGSYNDVKRIYLSITIPNKIISSTTPMGAGNTNGFRARVFKPRGGIVTN